MQGAGIEPGAPSAMDGDLLARARGGDLAAFEAIAVERLPGLYRTRPRDPRGRCGGRGGDLQHARRRMARAPAPGRPGAVRRVARPDPDQRVPDAAGARRPRGGLPPAGRCRSRVAAPDELDRDAILRMLDVAFESLDAADRAVLVLHDLEGRSPGAIADTVHLPLGTVKWRLHEAHLALRAALEVPA